MPASGAHPRLPYALRVTYAPMGGAPAHHTLGYRKNLRRAMEEVWTATMTWSRLVGGQYPVLFWSIVDCRTGTVHTTSTTPRGGASDGNQPKDSGSLF